MSYEPIYHEYYNFNIKASIYQLIQDCKNITKGNFLFFGKAIEYGVGKNKELDFEDLFFPVQTVRYYDVVYTSDIFSYYNDLDDDCIPIYGIIHNSVVGSVDIRLVKNYIQQRFCRYVFIEVKKSGFDIHVYDDEYNIHYSDVPMLIDTSEFEYKTDEIKAYTSNIISMLYDDRSSSVGYDYATSTRSYYTSPTTTTTTSVVKKEYKPAPINTKNPTITDLVKGDSVNIEGLKLILKATEENLHKYLEERLKDFYKDSDIISKGDYIFCAGEVPIMLVCHLDTVHATIPGKIFYDEKLNVMTSPDGIGGDDRTGVYALLKILCESKKKPYLLFTTYEENGHTSCLVAAKDLKDKVSDVHYMLEIDRDGKSQVVYYETKNPDFEVYVEKYGFEKHIGKGSDVKYLTQEWKIASCNVSAGNFNEHQKHEYINLTYLYDTIKKVVRMVEDAKSSPVFKQFK